jgi:hypothetical protein
MRAFLALFLAAGLTGSAFGYGGSYTGVELQRSKKGKQAATKTTGARSNTGAMVSEFSGGQTAASAGAASAAGHTGTTTGGLAPTSAAGTTAAPSAGAPSSIGSFSSGGLACPQGTEKDSTGRCVSAAVSAAASKAGAAGAGATGTSASAATTGTTGAAGYGSAPGYGAAGINPASAATQAVKQ